MSVNYTEEQVQYMIDLYVATPTRDTVEILSKEMNKSVKSIIGKLSREGVYQKTVYKTKTGEDPITKREIVENISEILDMKADWIMGLEKSPKKDLKNLYDRLYEFEHNAEEDLAGYQIVYKEEY